MTADRIIEVTMEKGRIDYRLWPCGLSSNAYGTLLADLATQIARMLEVEGNLDREDTIKEIREAFNKEIDKPMSTMVGMGQLQ
jgi:hypothetical protein